MIRIALAKGRLAKSSKKYLDTLEMGNVIDLESRKLVFKDNDRGIEYILLKPSDVLTYVENGVADLGIVGRDVIMEKEQSVYELLDLKFGICKFSIASLEGENVLEKNQINVATKYPNVAKRYFKKLNKSINIIPLNGSVELAPLVGLADCIVDIVETGSTLKANNLQVIEDMYHISARLICNPVSYRFLNKEVVDLVKQLEEVICAS